jgi:hypothetical protein
MKEKLPKVTGRLLRLSAQAFGIGLVHRSLNTPFYKPYIGSRWKIEELVLYQHSDSRLKELLSIKRPGATVCCIGRG